MSDWHTQLAADPNGRCAPSAHNLATILARDPDLKGLFAHYPRGTLTIITRAVPSHLTMPTADNSFPRPVTRHDTFALQAFVQFRYGAPFTHGDVWRGVGWISRSFVAKHKKSANPDRKAELRAKLAEIVREKPEWRATDILLRLGVPVDRQSVGQMADIGTQLRALGWYNRLQYRSTGTVRIWRKPAKAKGALELALAA